MSPDFIKQWEHIIDDVDKQKIPVEFISKLIINELDNVNALFHCGKHKKM